jgi:hypothetical protein
MVEESSYVKQPSLNQVYKIRLIIRRQAGRDLASWLERLTANAPVATVLGSFPASVASAQWNLRGGR